MSQGAERPSNKEFSGVVDLLVEHEIKLEALEYVLKETNPPVHELYLDTIENLRSEKAAQIHRTIARTIKSQP